MATIHNAAQNGDEAEVVRLLEQDPRRLNEQDAEFGFSPLIVAAVEGHDAVVTRLLALGADVALQGNDGETAAHLAFRHSTLALLIDAGAPLNARDEDGNTPLMKAVEPTPSIECVTVLLSRGRGALELNATNAYGWTAVHHAVSNRQPQILRLLFDAGAHPAIPDCHGDTPLDHARRVNANNPCIPLLEAALAEPQRPRLLLKARALTDAASDVRTAHATACPQGLSRIAHWKVVLAAAPPYLKRRVERGREMPTVEVNDEQQDASSEELGACVRFALGLEGHGGWAGAEDERATMREQGLFREVFVELAELLVPAWDRADV